MPKIGRWRKQTPRLRLGHRLIRVSSERLKFVTDPASVDSRNDKKKTRKKLPMIEQEIYEVERNGAAEEFNSRQ